VSPETTPVVPEIPVDQAISTDPTTVTFQVIDFVENNGPISHYQIIVVRLPNVDYEISSLESPDTMFPEDISERFSDINCGEVPSSPFAYVTAEMSADQYNALPDRLFVVGLNMNGNANSPNNRDGVTNGPLCFSTSYTFFVRAFTSNNIPTRAKRQTGLQYDLFTSSPYIPTPSVIREYIVAYMYSMEAL